jgi:hypothetical protein
MGLSTLVVQLREQVQRTQEDRTYWEDLPHDSKIAVAGVLWPRCEHLQKLGADAERGLAAFIDSLRPHLSDEALKAIVSIKTEHRFAELAEAVKSVERRRLKIERLIVPLQGAVRAVLRKNEAYKYLHIDGDLKEAIARLREIRARWDHCFNDGKVPKKMRWLILDLFEEYGPKSTSVFGIIERSTRDKLAEEQVAMANRLQQVRSDLAKTPTVLPKYAGSDIGQLLSLLDSVARQMKEEAHRLDAVREFLGGMETRGGKKHGRAKIIESLIPIYEKLTGAKATATYNPKTESRDSHFVRFVWDFVVAAECPDWLDGIETAIERSLQTRRKLTKDP